MDLENAQNVFHLWPNLALSAKTKRNTCYFTFWEQVRRISRYYVADLCSLDDLIWCECGPEEANLNLPMDKAKREKQEVLLV